MLVFTYELVWTICTYLDSMKRKFLMPLFHMRFLVQIFTYTFSLVLDLAVWYFLLLFIYCHFSLFVRLIIFHFLSRTHSLSVCAIKFHTFSLSVCAIKFHTFSLSCPLSFFDQGYKYLNFSLSYNISLPTSLCLILSLLHHYTSA